MSVARLGMHATELCNLMAAIGCFKKFRKDLRSAGPFFVSAAGLEPATNGLKGHCSTIELRAQQFAFYHASSRASTRNCPLIQYQGQS
jgi:hypothetical protein